MERQKLIRITERSERMYLEFGKGGRKKELSLAMRGQKEGKNTEHGIKY